MKAVIIQKFGDLEGSTLKTGIDIPRPSEHEVLIKVKAAGVNRPDILQRQGLYKVPSDASPIMGLEVAGEIVEAGENVTKTKIGTQVCALVPGGGYAQYVLTNEAHCFPVPKGLSMEQAAGLCECLFTVWINVVKLGQLKENERFLVHGGSSGIGMFAIQVAKQLGATVLTTVKNEEKSDFCYSLGADKVVQYPKQDFYKIFKSYKEGQEIDLILDMIGGDYFEKNIDLLNQEGRLVIIAFLKGNSVKLDLSKLMMKRINLTGSTLRPRTTEFKSKIAEELRETVWPLLNTQKIRVHIDSIFPLEEFKDAHIRMDSGNHLGKIILSLD
ncbi:NAD(P)H-quinone oxidoreductase [Paracoccaceae bacterium]|nr:NAD(P)H-quinone oxidoreductase [Paracoccaceae bacterium]